MKMSFKERYKKMDQLLAHHITPKAYYPGSIMAKYATGKYAKAISDRSGMEFPYEGNG